MRNRVKDYCLKRAKEIIDSRELSDTQKGETIDQLIRGIFQEEPEKIAPKAKRWPGRYVPEPDEDEIYFIWALIREKLQIIKLAVHGKNVLNGYIAFGASCETKEEAEFVKAHLEARNELIDELARLNKGWRPDWTSNETKWEPVYNRGINEIGIIESAASCYLPDCFQAKYEEIWLMAIKQLGEEKIILALWPSYGRKMI